MRQQTYDALGRLVSLTDARRHIERRQNDRLGQLVGVQLPMGDAAGQVIEVLHNGSERTTYHYRADGALLEANSARAKVAFERDALGRVLRETQNGHLVESMHNVSGQRLYLSSPLGAEVSIERDVAGRVRRIQAGTWQNLIERDAQGLELYRQVSGGVKIQWQYDTWGRPASQAVTVGNKGSRRSYRWQGASQLLELVDSTHGTTNFTYDAQSNLAATTYADGSQELRRLDAAGNIFRTPTCSDRIYSPTGQLLEANGTRYQYDAEGNLTHKTLPDGQLWLYGWDGAVQLVTVTQPGGHIVAFAYDALGRRVSKRYRGKVTRWVWDGNKPMHEWAELEVGQGAGSIADLTTWLFEEDSLVPAAKITAHRSYSVITDHLGTPAELYDEQGTKTW